MSLINAEKRKILRIKSNTPKIIEDARQFASQEQITPKFKLKKKAIRRKNKTGIKLQALNHNS